MNEPATLLRRLDAIGQALAGIPCARALIGLGSVGRELERLDAFSDLDFFAIVDPGQQHQLLGDLGWLGGICPIAFAFRNTADGYKLLFEDGIFCEFAIFDEPALAGIPFAPGRIVWKRAGVGERVGEPRLPLRQPAARDEEWLIGEALTNLYVGLCRYHRGEKLSAARFVQSYAVDRVLEWVALKQPGAASMADPFAPERRLERRWPELAEWLPRFVQGYDRSRESAGAILDYLQLHGVEAGALRGRIRDLCASDQGAEDRA